MVEDALMAELQEKMLISDSVKGTEAIFLPPYYYYENGIARMLCSLKEKELPWKWTEIAERCPVAYDYFKNHFPYQSYMRLRFMRLAPGGFIGPHHDATSYILGAVNISLNNPAGCEMVLKDVGVVPFKNTGSVINLNTSYEHMVWNQGTEPRYHMIVHGMWNYNWNNIVINSYKNVLQIQQDTCAL